jgi:hypothetical protein
MAARKAGRGEGGRAMRSRMGAAALGGSGREVDDGVRRAAARIWARERAATAGGGFSSRWLRRRWHRSQRRAAARGRAPQATAMERAEAEWRAGARQLGVERSERGCGGVGAAVAARVTASGLSCFFTGRGG